MKVALEQLHRDPVRYAAHLGFARNQPVRAQQDPRGTVLVGRSDREWVYIATDDPGFFDEVVDRQLEEQGSVALAVLEDWMFARLRAARTVTWTLSSLRLVYPATQPPPDPGGGVEQLTPDEAEAVHASYGYRDLVPLPYLRDRILRGPALCLRVGTRLAAWCFTHDDGAIGLLEVLPPFRRRGFGRRLLASLVTEVRARGHLPFVQVEPTNAASLALARGLGFEDERHVHWAVIEGQASVAEV